MLLESFLQQVRMQCLSTPIIKYRMTFILIIDTVISVTDFGNTNLVLISYFQVIDSCVQEGFVAYSKNDRVQSGRKINCSVAFSMHGMAYYGMVLIVDC